MVFYNQIIYALFSFCTLLMVHLWCICSQLNVILASTKCMYSKTCVKRPLKNRQNKDLNDKC